MKLTNQKWRPLGLGEAQLIEAHPDPSGQTPEALVLLAKGLLVLLGRRAGRLHAYRGHALGHLGRSYRVVHRAVEPRDDLARRASGNEHAEWRRHVEPRIHGLGHGGNLRG